MGRVSDKHIERFSKGTTMGLQRAVAPEGHGDKGTENLVLSRLRHRGVASSGRGMQK